MLTVAEIKSWFLAHFLKRYVLEGQTQNIRPMKHIDCGGPDDSPVFRDKFRERHEEKEYQEIDLKVQAVLADLRARGKL
jgi:hypothetical protein